MKALILALLLSGCITWHADESMRGAPIVIATTDAYRICSEALGRLARACAITISERCLVIIQPGDDYAEEHERKHCEGFNH